MSRSSNTFRGPQSPAFGAMVVTPSDTVDLSTPVRAVTLGTGGTLSFIGDDGQPYTTASLPAGTYPVFARRINAAGTSASNITGWI